jgi:Protein of unknown function (DUF4232)
MELMQRRSRSGVAILGLAAAVACGTGVAAAHTLSAGAAGTTPRCEVRNLRLAAPRSDGAAGSIGLRFTFRNRGPATCRLYGFPGMRLENAHRKAMSTTVIRGTSTVVPFEPENAVLVAPGGRASFFAGYSDVPTGSQTCPRSAYIQVTPPNDYKQLTVPLSATACGGVITVSPVVPGVPQP